MPIYEYYSPDTHKIYSFFAKTLAQGARVPKCPDRAGARMIKIVSGFAIGGGKKDDGRTGGPDNPAPGPDDARMEAAMAAMESEMAGADENDPRAMARMMRRMAELSGEKIDGPMEEAVRKLEEGADPDQLEEEFGDVFGDDGPPGSPDATATPGVDEKARNRPRIRRPAPTRDPKLYDYD